MPPMDGLINIFILLGKMIDKIDNLKILMSAFACDPNAGSGLGGGEDILGWNMIMQVSKFAKVHVLASPKNKKGIDDFFSKNKICDIYFYYIELPGIIRKPLELLWSHGGSQAYCYFWQIKAYFVAKKLHKINRFDIFHQVTYANDWMASYIGALLPIAYVRGPCGGAHKTPKAFLSEYDLKQRIWQYFRSFYQWLFRHDPFFIIGQKRAKKILVCNKEAFVQIPKKYVNKVEMMPVNGISQKDLDFLDSCNANKSNNFLVLSAGRLFPIKGFKMVIKSFALFNKEYPNSNLLIVGDGPELKELKQLVEDCSIKNKVIFEQWMDREKLLFKMASCDAFVFLSLRDGGGAVVVEAMAASKPVICLDLAGPGFHISKDWGIKIKPDYPNQVISDVSKSLELLYKNKDTAKSIGVAARRRIEDFYLWDKLGDKMYGIYQKALNKK